MISAILSILGSSAVGSLIGGVFAWLNKKSDLEAKKLDQEHEVRRWNHDLALRDKDIEYATIEAQGKKEVAIEEAEGSIESARMAAIGASHQADVLTGDELRAAGKYRWMLVVADTFRRFIRPWITVIMVSCALYINWLLVNMFVEQWSEMTLTQRFEAGMQAFAWITGQCSLIIGYWFVSRGQAR